MIAINNRTQPAFEGALKQARPDEIAGEVRDQAQQIINAADNAGDATRAADNAGDAAKATDNADEAAMRTPDDANKGSGGGGNNGGGTSGPVNRAVPQDVADELVSSGKFDEIEDALGISDEVATSSRGAVELTDEIAETADDAVERVRNHNPTTGHTEGWGGFDITVSEMWKTKRNFTPGDRQMMQDLKTAYTGLEDLNPQTWATLSARERKRAVQQSIKSTMEAMGIPKSRWPKVTLTSLPPGQYGWADWSPLSKRGELCINIDNAVGDVVGTVAHESRHYFQMWQAYQHQVLGRALDRLHPHTGEWMPNLPSFGGTYHSSGSRYFTQPIEADAETFGRRVIDLLPARWPKSAAQQAGNAGGATKTAGNAGGTARAIENARNIDTVAGSINPPNRAVTRAIENGDDVDEAVSSATTVSDKSAASHSSGSNNIVQNGGGDFDGLDPDIDGTLPSIAYRVQGGTPPKKISHERVQVGENGEIKIVPEPGKTKQTKLYITFDDPERMRVYLRDNRPGGYIISFEVDPDFVQEIRANARRQAEIRGHRNMPEISDPRQTSREARERLGLEEHESTAYGLPANWIERLEQAARPGTAKIEEGK